MWEESGDRLKKDAATHVNPYIYMGCFFDNLITISSAFNGAQDTMMYRLVS